MRIEEINSQINFKNQKPQNEKKQNLSLAVCGGALLMPLIPIIDGDSFRSTFKNRNVMKSVTGLAAIGGLIAGANILNEKYNNSNNKTTFKTALLAVSAPLLLTVDRWAEKNSKPIAKKWYFVSALVGGAIGFIMSRINNKK